ncbi:MAG: restriction endonuclease subunit S [Acidilobus sp.]|jgi:type I restriction enzyme S subunit
MDSNNKKIFKMLDRIPNGWKYQSLYDLAEYINGKAFKQSELNDKGLPVIKIAELHNGITTSTKYYNGKIEDWFYLKGGELLFAWSGSVGVFVWKGGPAVLNQHIFKVNAKTGIDQRFLRYLLEYHMPIFKLLVRDKATTMGHVRIEDLKNIEAAIPPLQEQRKIGEILGSLDDKIELNHEMNKTLEAIAQAIYENWFVDFEPFKDKLVYNKELGKKIPEEWEVRKISELFDMVKGRKCDLLEKCRDTSEGCLPYLTIETFEEGALKYWTKEKHPFVEIEDIVLVADGERAGKILRFKTGVLGSTLLMLKQKSKNYDLRNYVFLLLKDMERELTRHKTGSAVPHLDKGYLANLKIIIPQPPSIIENFNKFVKPIFEKIILNLEEIATLRSIRDALLPKLLSGEIRVKVDVEKGFPEETRKLEEIKEKKAEIQASLEKWLKNG